MHQETTKLLCINVTTIPKILYKHNINSLSLKRTQDTDSTLYPLALKASKHMWGFPKALLHLLPYLCGLGTQPVTDYKLLFTQEVLTPPRAPI